jgi:hypothetical protein
MGRGRGPDPSKEPKCERPKEHGDRQGGYHVSEH